MVVVVALTVIGFLSGAIGQKLFGVQFPSWLNVGVPVVELPAEAVFHIGSGEPVMVWGAQVYPIPITNTMITTWITILVLLIISLIVTRKPRLIPSRIQSLMEFALEWIYNLCKDVAGEKNGRRFFPVVCTIFLFVLVNAWMNLIPGYGSLMVYEHGIEFPLLRGANTDFNTPLALSIVSFVFVTYYGLKNGKFGFVKQFFNVGRFGRGFADLVKGKVKPGCSGMFFGAINIFVSFLELISYFIRLLSFTFRLFGNMTGGEILVLMFLYLFSWAISGSIIYGFELLIGAVQALIFAGLTLVFATMASSVHEEEH
ncbi:MAG: F0F1 ATP synthase subunit A [Dehalococcoidales bacterium]|nr:F0F1 ATP synthase subunit A [Dehalococcoidales bacterium]